jgi:hypothetical protein
MALDQMKMLNDLRKAQAALKKQIIEVEAGEVSSPHPPQSSISAQ